MWDIAKRDDHIWAEGYWYPNPMLPVNFWAMFCGFAFNAAAQAGTDQIAVQRYLATKNVADAQKSGAAGAVMNCAIGASLTFLGLALWVINLLHLPLVLPRLTCGSESTSTSLPLPL